MTTPVTVALTAAPGTPVDTASTTTPGIGA